MHGLSLCCLLVEDLSYIRVPLSSTPSDAPYTGASQPSAQRLGFDWLPSPRRVVVSAADSRAHSSSFYAHITPHTHSTTTTTGVGGGV